ncbi:DNA adenine methylase [Desulfovibrio sp. OttesenSCG-928-A18]|nr:DNA adenine methylase [Desulfovibrio sp. OttesenSCG-928-A18]
MPTTLSPLRYPGGKSSLSNFLASTIHLNGLMGGTYVEPFCGGAGAAINLLLTGQVSKIILNDIDDMIYYFWFSILNYTDLFIRKIESTSVDIAEWRKQREILNDPSSSIFDKGFAAFFLNRCNRSGILRANPIGGLAQSGKWLINARFNKKNLINKIERIATFQEHIMIKNKNAIEFIKDDILTIEEKVFIYYDPPYYKQGPLLYLNALADYEHAKLASEIIRDKKNIWILTYDKNPQIEHLYYSAVIIPFQLNYSAHLHKKGEEILIAPNHIKLPQHSPSPYYGRKIFLQQQ